MTKKKAKRQRVRFSVWGEESKELSIPRYAYWTNDGSETRAEAIARTIATKTKFSVFSLGFSHRVNVFGGTDFIYCLHIARPHSSGECTQPIEIWFSFHLDSEEGYEEEEY